MTAERSIAAPSPWVKDIRGEKFGRLTALSYEGMDARHHSLWKFRCDCGTIKIMRGTGVRRGSTVSCGCYHDDSAANRRRTHGMTGKPEYIAWRNMIKRCTDPKAINYERYGGRGIKVCKRWMKFESFLEDMGLRPGSGFSLDRKNNNGDYEPANCVWETAGNQMRNRRSTRLIKFAGKTRCIGDWANELGCTSSTIRIRLEQGWSIKKSLTTLGRKKTPKNIGVFEEDWTVTG